MSTAAANLLTEWARLLLDSFAAAGVTDVVISPGSRSTPFVAAAIAHPDLTCTDIHDERAAAFYALGQARASGRPSLLLCTSGTAGAHYLPAVIEAAQAHVPLLALTADRPVELTQCAAPQTIDQLKLFGDHARAFFDLGAPEAGDAALRGLRRAAAQAVFTSRWPRPGAVHLNARARKPLEPYPLEDVEPAHAANPEHHRPEHHHPEHDLFRRVDALCQQPITRPYAPQTQPNAEAIQLLVSACRAARSGLIVAGPAALTQHTQSTQHARHTPRTAILRLAALTGYPLLAEATSQLRFFACDAAIPPDEILHADAFDTLLHSEAFRRTHAPDVVLQVGAPPTSGLWQRYLDEHPRHRRFVLAAHGWNDPGSSAEALIYGDVGDIATAVADQLEQGPRRVFHRAADEEDGSTSPWRRSWTLANRNAWASADGLLEDTGDPLTEALATRLTVDSTAAGELLALGNSLAVRHVDTWCRARRKDLRVWSQRGANGIDGLIAGTAGAAQAAGRPATLLLGDVSFLHDLGGLACAAQLDVPFVIVVLHNDGGRIFEMLPIARTPGIDAETLRHWTTPHGRDLGPAAQLWGLRHERVRSADDLRRALAEARAAARPTVVEVLVPTDGDLSAAAFQRRLWADVDTRLRPMLEAR